MIYGFVACWYGPLTKQVNKKFFELKMVNIGMVQRDKTGMTMDDGKIRTDIAWSCKVSSTQVQYCRVLV